MLKAKLRIAVFFLLMAFASGAQAGSGKNEKTEAAHKYVASLPIKSVVRSAFEAALPNDPDVKLIVEKFDVKAVDAAIEKALVKEFTPDELKSLAGSLDPASGGKPFAKAPKVMEIVSGVLQVELQKTITKHFQDKDKGLK